MTARGPTLREIARNAAEQHGLTVDQLLSPARHRLIAWPRQDAMLLAYVQRRWDGERTYSMARIGRFFGDRDHTTVLHAVRASLRRCANG